jgi:aryl-alcohol dehydrogenase-like predicted oxidoreductase
MESRGNRAEMVIATKYTATWTTTMQPNKKNHHNSYGNGAKSLRESLNGSLKRLKTDYVDVL